MLKQKRANISGRGPPARHERAPPLRIVSHFPDGNLGCVLYLKTLIVGPFLEIIPAQNYFGEFLNAEVEVEVSKRGVKARQR